MSQILAALLAVLAAFLTPVPAPAPAPAPLPACQEEDGSTPGQVFPCYWDAQAHGNGQGTSYVIGA